MMNAGNLNGRTRQMKDWRRRFIAFVAALTLLISSCGLTAFAESDEGIYSAPVTAPIAPANTSPEPEEGIAEVTPAPEGQEETGTEPAEGTGEKAGEETSTETEGEPEASEEPEDLTAYESGTLVAEADGVGVTLDYTPEARIPEGTVLTLSRAAGGDLYSAMKSAARVLKEEENETWQREVGDEAVFYLLTLTNPEGIVIHPDSGITFTCANLTIPEGSTGFVTGIESDNIDWDTNLTLAYLPEAIGYANLKQVQIGTITLVHNDRDYMVTASYGPEAGFPFGTALKVREIMPGTPEYALYSGMTDETLNEDWSEITLERYFDISFVKGDVELEPKGDVDVQITFRDKIEENEDTEVAAVHIENNEATVIESETDSQKAAKHDDEAIDTVTFTSDSFSVYGVVQKKKIVTKILDAQGHTYEIEVTYTQEAEIPEDAQVKVEEIPEGSDLWEAYRQQTAAALNADDVRLPGLYDISIVDAEGNKVDPKAAVNVAFKLLNDETTEDIQVVHFKEEIPQELVEVAAQGQETTEQTEVQIEPLAAEDRIESEEIKASVEGDAVTFNTDSFSVYAFAYTIVTYYKVASGETYRITLNYDENSGIPAGSELHVEELLPETDRYNEYLVKAAETIGRGTDEIFSAHFFDIEITKDGQKIEPTKPVEVTIKYVDPIEINEEDTLQVVHFAENGTEIISDVIVNDDHTQVVYYQDSFSVTGMVVSQNSVTSGKKYAVIVNYNDQWYSVKIDGSLELVSYNASSNTVTMPYALLWYYKQFPADGSRYTLSAASDAVHYNDKDLGDVFVYNYICPNNASGMQIGSEQNPDSTQNLSWWPTIIYDGQYIRGDTGNNFGNYIGVVNENGKLRIHQCNQGQAAQIRLVNVSETTIPNPIAKNNTVNHLDISVHGKARITVPLSNGTYYDQFGTEVLTVTSNNSKELSYDVNVEVEKDDIRNAKVDAQDINGNPINNAFYVTGYSGNSGDLDPNANSDRPKQIRIEGSFKVSTVDPYNPWFNGSEEANWNSTTDLEHNTWFRGHCEERKQKQITYTVSIKKYVHQDLIYEGKTLYRKVNGQLVKQEVTVPVTLSGSCSYWDFAKNSCPGTYVYGTKSKWEAGCIIDNGGYDASGIDFTLAGSIKTENDSFPTINITKIVVDESGNRIDLRDIATSTFDVYLSDTVDEQSIVNGTFNYSNYSPRQTLTASVEGEGIAYCYYDLSTQSSMAYIKETGYPSTVIDKSDNTWNYVKTRIETEYVKRTDSDDNDNHKVDGRTSIPEVVGKFTHNGQQRNEAILNFYVYNVYQRPASITVNKEWTDLSGAYLGAEKQKTSITVQLWKHPTSVADNDKSQDSKVDEKTITKDDGWSYTWTNLDSNYKYYIAEVPLVGGNFDDASYIINGIEPPEGGVPQGTIRLINVEKSIKVKLRKCEKGSTPGTTGDPIGDVQFKLYDAAGWNETPKVTYDSTNVLTSNSTDGIFYQGYLPAGTYYLEEIATPEGYVALTEPVIFEILTTPIPGKEGYYLRYKYGPSGQWQYKKSNKENIFNLYVENEESVSVSVNKAWLHADGSSGWPEGVSVTVQVYDGGTAVAGKTAVLDVDTQSATISNLPKYRDGNAINYTVKEIGISGGTINSDDYNTVVTGSMGSGFTITNTSKLISLNVTKVWSDNDNASGARPAFVTVQLYSSQENFAEPIPGKNIILSESNGWTDGWTDLDDQYTYKAQELAVSGYTTAYNPTDGVYPVTDGKNTNGDTITITNTRNTIPGPEDSTTSVLVQKKWIDNDTPVTNPPDTDAVQVKLVRYKAEAVTGNLVIHLFKKDYNDQPTISAWNVFGGNNTTTVSQGTITFQFTGEGYNSSEQLFINNVNYGSNSWEWFNKPWKKTTSLDSNGRVSFESEDKTELWIIADRGWSTGNNSFADAISSVSVSGGSSGSSIIASTNYNYDTDFEPVTLSSTNTWQYEFTNLPKSGTQGGTNYTYKYAVIETDKGTGTVTTEYSTDGGTTWTTESDWKDGDNNYPAVAHASNANQTVIIKNKREQTNPGSLKITKNVTISGVAPASGDTRTNGEYFFTVAGPYPSTETVANVSITIEGGAVVSGTLNGSSTDLDDGYVVIHDLEVGSYTVTETTPENGTVVSKIDNTETDTNEKTVTINSGETISVAFTNDLVIYKELTISKEWYLGNTSGTPISNPTGEKYQKSFSIYQTKTEITGGTNNTDVTVDANDSTVTVNGETTVHPGDILNVAVPEGLSISVDWNENSKYKNNDKSLTLTAVGSSNYRFTVPANATAIHIGHWPVEETPPAVTVSVVSSTSLALFTKEQVRSMTGTKYSEDITLPYGGAWTKTIEVPVNDHSGNPYYYYIVENSPGEDTTYAYSASDNSWTIKNVERRTGSLTIGKNVLNTLGAAKATSGTFYFGVYTSSTPTADNLVDTGSISINLNDTDSGTITIPGLYYDTYYVFELDGENGNPVTSNYVVINDVLYNVSSDKPTGITVAGYTGQSGVADVTITNREEPTVNVTATKLWDRESERVSAVQFTLYRKVADSSVTDAQAPAGAIRLPAETGNWYVQQGEAQAATQASNWQTAWTDLQSRDVSGEVITYRVEETGIFNGDLDSDENVPSSAIWSSPTAKYEVSGNGDVTIENGIGNIIITNTEKEYPTFKVIKEWFEVLPEDLENYPTVYFTLYQMPYGKQNFSEAIAYKVASEPSIEIPLRYPDWTWECKEYLPEFDDNGNPYQYFVAEKTVSGDPTSDTTVYLDDSTLNKDGEIQVKVIDYSSNDDPSNTTTWTKKSYGAQDPHTVRIGNTGVIKIRNKTLEYMQMDVKKKYLYFYRNQGGYGYSLGTGTAEEPYLHDRVLVIQVMRRAVLDDGSETEVFGWEPYANPIAVGYGPGGITDHIERNGIDKNNYSIDKDNPFLLIYSSAWEWYIKEEPTAGGLVGYGFYKDNGTNQIHRVRYQYTLKEIGAYKDRNLTQPLNDFDWIAILPEVWDGNGKHTNVFGNIEAQDPDRLVNIQSTDLEIAKTWDRTTSDVEEIYVKIYRNIGDNYNSTSWQDYTEVIGTILGSSASSGLSNKVDGEISADRLTTINNKKYIKVPADGTSVTISRIPTLLYTGSATKYYYWVEECGYKPVGGDPVMNTDCFEVSYTVSNESTLAGNGRTGSQVIELGPKNSNSVVVHNALKDGRLTINKEVTEGSDATGKEFVFQVVLTPEEGVTIDTTSLGLTGENASLTSVEKNNETGVVTVIVTITGANSGTITGIPAGTTYEVTEPSGNMPSGWQQFGEVEYSDKDTDENAVPTINSNTTDEVTITNAPGISIDVTKQWMQGNDPKTTATEISFTLHQVLTADGHDSIDDVYTGYGINNDGVGTVQYDPAKNEWETINIPNLPLTVTKNDVEYNASYYVEETNATADAGYILSSTTYSNEADAAHPSTDPSSKSVNTNGKTITIINIETPGVELPGTGGSGTLIYTIAGMGLIVLAGALLVSRRKRKV